jgi:preprotein translocase subunit YajC
VDAVIPIVWFAFLAAMFFVFIVRPQRRKLQAFEAMQATVEIGDEILTTSGLFGTVRGLDEETFELEIAPGTVVRFAHQAIGRILTEHDEQAEHDEQDGHAEHAEHPDSADAAEVHDA